jgi:hypothetical protein
MIVAHSCCSARFLVEAAQVTGGQARRAGQHLQGTEQDEMRVDLHRRFGLQG